MKYVQLLCLVPFLSSVFLLSQSSPVPFVNQPLVPTSAIVHSPGLTLTVRGAGFVPTSVVNWNGVPLSTTFVSANHLQAYVPASDLVVSGTSSVTVSNPAAGGGISDAVAFSIRKPTNTLALAAPKIIPSGLNPGGIVVADFNHDGKLDLAFVNQSEPDPTCINRPNGAGTISIFLGSGNGKFSNKSTLCVPYLGQYGSNYWLAPQLEVGDFNGDGNVDISAWFLGDSRVENQIFLGNGDGTFTNSGEFGAWDGVGGAIAADFNRDGKLDLVFPADFLGANTIYTYLGNGDGTLSPYSEAGPDGLPMHANLATGDFNNDGILDLAIAAGPVTILLGNGDGSFTLAPSQPSVTLVYSASVVAGDFDGDGILDLAIADSGSTALEILKGNGDGTFTQLSGEPELPQFSNFVTAADFNADGKLDLVVSSEANTLSLLLGNGDGTFKTGFAEAIDYAPYGVAVGDFNGDGKLDLAVTNAGDNTVSILLQTAARAGVSITLASGQNPVAIGRPVTYDAVAWADPVLPTGSIAFKQGSVVIGTAALTNGFASVTATFTKAGTFPVIASYSGDQNYPEKSSKAVKQVVTKYMTSTELDSNPNPSAQGQAVVFAAYVSSAGAAQGVTPTGRVIFKNGSALLGSANLVSGAGVGTGTATITTSHLPVGPLSITATYQGDAASAKSVSPALIQVVN